MLCIRKAKQYRFLCYLLQVALVGTSTFVYAFAILRVGCVVVLAGDCNTLQFYVALLRTITQLWVLFFLAVCPHAPLLLCYSSAV
jgi:hypothetical protein